MLLLYSSSKWWGVVVVVVVVDRAGQNCSQKDPLLYILLPFDCYVFHVLVLMMWCVLLCVCACFLVGVINIVVCCC